MKKRLTYQVAEVVPYINWLYFYHVWGLSGKPKAEKEKIQEEAQNLLRDWQDKYHTHALFTLYEAYSDGDDLLLDGFRMPMLRQQHPASLNQPNLCLADFVCPISQKSSKYSPVQSADLPMEQASVQPSYPGIANHVGVFCATVDGGIAEAYRHDEYLGMMAQVLSDRLAEATAEKLHQEVRKSYWGYAPDEQLSIPQLHHEEYQGIRPAIGYPSLPDTSANFIIDQLLDMKQVGIRLTETGMMTPHASVSGLMFAHPQARYFELGKIDDTQLRDYARRRGIPVEMMRRFLQSSLMRK